MHFFYRISACLIAAAIFLFGNSTLALSPDHFWEAAKRLRGAPTKQAKQNINNYIINSSFLGVQAGLDTLLASDPNHLLRARRKAARRIKIDGSGREWRRLPAISATDLKRDLKPIREGRDQGRYLGSDDIKSAAFIIDNKAVTFKIELFAAPKKRKSFYYALNFLKVNHKLAYAISCTRAGFYLHTYNQESGTWVKAKQNPKGSRFALRGAVFEGRVPLSLLKKLPARYYVEAVSWAEDRNVWDNLYFYLQHNRGAAHYYNDALELFTKYAERVALTPDDPLPLAQAIVDGYLYRIADSATKDLIIRDGLSSIEYAAITQQYSFNGQKKVTALDFPELLVWASRSLSYSINSARWKLWNSFEDTGGLLNQEIYRHISVSVETLDQARQIIAEHGLLVEGNLAETLRKIEQFLMSIWKYRAELSFIEKLYQFDPFFYQELYEQVKYEFDNDLVSITTVYLDSVYKHWNQSAAFQTRFIKEHGYFFGNCADTTAIAWAFGKALGIPTIHQHYDVVGENGYFQPVHSFPAYYSSKREAYLGYSSGDNIIFGFAPSGQAGDQVFTYIELPIVSSLWQIADQTYPGTPVRLPSNSCGEIITLNDWHKINMEGLADSKIARCLGFK